MIEDVSISEQKTNQPSYVFVILCLFLIIFPFITFLILVKTYRDVIRDDVVRWDEVIDFRRLVFLHRDLGYVLSAVGIVLTLIFCAYAVRRSLWYLWLIPWQACGLGGVLLLWLFFSRFFAVEGRVKLEDTTYRLVTTSYYATVYACDGWRCQGRDVYIVDSAQIVDATIIANEETGELVIIVDTGLIIDEIVIPSEELPTFDAIWGW